MIFRDDDIGYLTKLEEFEKVHQIFGEYDCLHTIAILTKDLHHHVRLVDYIKNQKNIDCQVHSYQHVDFSLATEKEVKFQLRESKKIIEDLFGVKPTVFYPPFNTVNLKVIQIASEEGLRTSYEKVSCVYYLKHRGDVMHKVVNFHYHDTNESVLIEPVLKLYKELCQQSSQKK